MAPGNDRACCSPATFVLSSKPVSSCHTDEIDHLGVPPSVVVSNKLVEFLGQFRQCPSKHIIRANMKQDLKMAAYPRFIKGTIA